MKIAIIGTGFVGLTSGACFAKKGHDVFCIDIDEMKINNLQKGIVPFFEPGLEELVLSGVKNQKLSFTTSLKEAVSGAQLIFLCVGTPPKEDGSADLKYVYQVADGIGLHLSNKAVVVLKSTVPAGTEREVKKRIISNIQPKIFNFYIASNPEFLAEGSAVHDFMNPDRTIVGLEDDAVQLIFKELYQDFPGELLFTSIASAMMAKYAANAFLATKISFINEIANICENVGANVLDVAKGMSLDPRIGPHFLKAGIGYGGSCFPKDVLALAKIADESGHDFRLLKSVIDVNENQRGRFLQKIKNELGDLAGKKICVWGLAFKPGTDDIRKSVSIDLINDLRAEGASVCAYDYKAMESAKCVLTGIEFADSPLLAAVDADALIIATDWNEFKKIDLNALRSAMKQTYIFDGRNLFDGQQLRQAGFHYFGVGR